MAPQQSLRITGGRLRGRKLVVPNGLDVRPTSDRVREALFNRMVHGGFGESGTSILTGAKVLDLCSGTGALAYEALSRGAHQAVLVDVSPNVLRVSQENAAAIGLSEVCTFHLRQLPQGLPSGSFDIVFLDPPYSMDLYRPILDAIIKQNTLHSDGLLLVETSAALSLSLPSGFEMLHKHRYGRTALWLLRKVKN